MSETVSLKVHNDRSELASVLAAVEGLAEREAWAPDLSFKTTLAVEELVLNVMEYAFDGGSHEFEVSFSSDPTKITIEIVDSGKAFDPLSDAPAPDVDAPAEDRPIGGLGIHLVRNMMDSVEYRRESDRNYLTIVAYREK